MVEHEIAESPKILWSANFLDPFTTYTTVSAPYLLYSLPYSQLKSGSQVLGGEILDTEIEFSQHWGLVKSNYWYQWTSQTSCLAEKCEKWTTKSCNSNTVKPLMCSRKSRYQYLILPQMRQCLTSIWGDITSMGGDDFDLIESNSTQKSFVF